MDNLDLWKKVEKTDLDHTKHVNQRGGYTAIAPQYQAKMATEQFGPYGHGWGLAESDFNMDLFEATGMVIHKAVFFYLLDGNVQTFPIHNAINPQMGSGDKKRNDEDWCKKIETNTISKALSRLGFNADVFMGLFDDHEYVDQLATEQSINKAEDKESAIKEKQAVVVEYVENQRKAIKDFSEAPTINGVVKAATRHLTRQKKIVELASVADRGLKTIVREAEARLSTIEGKDNA